MAQHAGVFRHNAGLLEADAALERLQRDYDEAAPAPFSQYSLETQSILTAARLVVKGAMARRQNVGLHFNADLAITTPNSGAAGPGAAKGSSSQAT
jgi:L-aspartate oxidase